VLRPGGSLRLMEPRQGAQLHRVASLGYNLRHLASMLLWRPFSRAYGRFSTQTLAETLSAAGFAQTRVEETLAGQGLIAVATRPSA
jgi:hypothetical protein